MTVFAAGLSALLLATPTSHFLAVGSFKETGSLTRGDGLILAAALEWELTATGDFDAIADAESQRARKAVIAKTNRLRTDERYWIELGHEVGASHLLRGEVWESPRICYARAKLIELATGKAKVTSPEPYDCSEQDLRALAGDLAQQLIGKRASPKVARARPVEKSVPLAITLVGEEGTVNGRPIRTARKAEPTPVERPPPAPPPSPPPPPAIIPPPPVAPLPVVPPPTPTRWPGFTTSDRSYSVYDLALDVQRRAPLFGGLILLIPVLAIFAGAIALPLKRDLAVRIVETGFGLSVLLACLTMTTILFYTYGIDRPILDDVDILAVGAPFAAVGVWLIGGRMLVTYAEMKLFRRVFSVILYGAFFSVALMIASQVHMPAILLAFSTLVFHVVIRLANQARRNRRERQASANEMSTS